MGVREPLVLRHRAIEAAPSSHRIANVRRARDWFQQHLQVFRPIAIRALYERSVGVVIAMLDNGLYILSLFGEQREAVKLLEVKFLYQFGINAAVPFLPLFIVEEIGTNGWLDMLGVIGLAGTVLAGIDAQGISQLMATVLLLITAAFAIPVGLLGDRFGKKRIFALGLFVMGATALFAAFATRIPQLLLYLRFLGFGNTALTVLFGGYLAELIPAERVGEFTGLTAFAETGGVFLSILVAGEIISLNLFGLKYRMIFLISDIFLLLALGAVAFVKARLGDAPLVDTWLSSAYLRRTGEGLSPEETTSPSAGVRRWHPGRLYDGARTT